MIIASPPTAGFHSGAVGYSNPQLNIKPPGRHTPERNIVQRMLSFAGEQTPDVMNALNALLKVRPQDSRVIATRPV